MAPPRLASGLQSLPPILHMTAPSSIPGCSKAPRGLFVLPRVARVFTGTAISPSPPSRQWPSRSTIHAGRNLPDKGLRYLRHLVTPPTGLLARGVGRSFLPASACRHADRTISYPTFRKGFRRMVSEDSLEFRRGGDYRCGYSSPDLHWRAAPPIFSLFGTLTRRVKTACEAVHSHLLGLSC